MFRKTGMVSFALSKLTSAAGVAALLGLIFPQAAYAQDGLTFFKNYFVTGDYVVGGVGVRGTGTGGFAQNAVNISGVPENADVVAAFLYWSSVIALSSPNSGLTGVQFKGNDINEVGIALNPAGTSPCWSAGAATGSTDGSKGLVLHRADVLRFFEEDENGHLIVNGAHTVRLPDTGGGNAVPFTLGASLLVIYRTPTDPLRAVVLYDGGFTLGQGSDVVTQTVQGFYQASSVNPVAKATVIAGDGQANFPERLVLNGSVVENPFTGSLGDAWDSPTYPISLPGNADSATMTIDHVGTPFDCITGGVFALSTTVQDTDLDGLLDNWELSTAGYPCPPPSVSSNCDPKGDALPDLAAMGANPLRKDIFVEVGYNWSNGWDPATSGQVPVPGVHSHLPSLQVLSLAGQAFVNSPVKNPHDNCGQAGQPACQPTGINPHFDIGAHYQPPVPPMGCANPGTWTVDCAIIPTALSRGGEALEERACVEDPTAMPPKTCVFPAFRGVYGWKLGYVMARDAFVDELTGAELTESQEQACESATPPPYCVRRRFDPVRKDMFHYTLFAHALGFPIAEVDDPATPDVDEAHTPRRNSGAGDKPGGDSVVTLGLWINPSDFVIASTWTHELGHNGWLDHAGDPFNPYEENCNPNHLSVMNYLFQLTGLGLFPVIDFSRSELGTLNEASLQAGLGTLDYPTAWFAPRIGLHPSLATATGAKRHCNGTPLSPAEEADRLAGGGMVRIAGVSNVTPPIDWNGDLQNNDAGIAQDVTFNGMISNGTVPPPENAAARLRGFNDWAFFGNVGLRQLGSRRNVLGLSVDVGRLDTGRLDTGRLDTGRLDTGRLDTGRLDTGDQELDPRQAEAIGNPAHSLSATKVGKNVVVSWQEPHFRHTGVQHYQLFRVPFSGPTITADDLKKQAMVAQTSLTTAPDTSAKAGTTYWYYVVTYFVDGSVSTWSHPLKFTVPK